MKYFARFASVGSRLKINYKEYDEEYSLTFDPSEIDETLFIPNPDKFISCCCDLLITFKSEREKLRFRFDEGNQEEIEADFYGVMNGLW